MYFPVAGVTVCPALPFLVSLVISILCSMGGLSGATFLLAFQVSVLGFSGPAVTPTNHLFNVVAIPSGVFRYIREKRMVWPLALVIVAGTVPGVVVGSWLRIRFLRAVRHFKLFMAGVMLLISSRLVQRVLKPVSPSLSRPGDFQVKTVRFDLLRVEYDFGGVTHGVPTPLLTLLTIGVGMIGGAYGIGGGAIISPFLISVFDLPVHTIAGASLCGTCLTSLIGVSFFALARPLLGIPRLGPDWMLGTIFGLGGLVGVYVGARLQKRFSARVIEAILGVALLSIAVSYLVGFFS
jgi:uncharacterized protein